MIKVIYVRMMKSLNVFRILAAAITVFFCSALRPPVPPAFSPSFSRIVNLLCCDVIIHILRHILQRPVDDRSTHWTEAMIQRVQNTSLFSLFMSKCLLPSSVEAPELISSSYRPCI